MISQENNALAKIDLSPLYLDPAGPPKVELIGLGFKNHMAPGNGLDASDCTCHGTLRKMGSTTLGDEFRSCRPCLFFMRDQEILKPLGASACDELFMLAR